ncbi:eukaryotic translation initiation factor 4E type 1B-like [Lepus europaeus]|uniref:eukaryotic translation initiation factor 4E type 1B-like n=1 Tax=Lepus europaeus TaxID=9983 RepID=UPI002B484C18|nr:eukaryotic translation initiation factor 4E type 1B-like [Lepus europaeus]
MAATGPVCEVEGRIQEQEEEKKEKEEEVAAVGAFPGGQAQDSPRASQPLWRKVQNEVPAEAHLGVHPLQNRWALWFFTNERSRAWQDNLHLVTKVDTVEDFWAMYSHIQLASKLSSGCDYALFKLLCLIEESFEEHSREVCGALLNVRTKGDKIAVWTREAENQAGVMHIGWIYKERLGLSTKTVICYQAHTDKATKSNSLAKNKFVV